MNFAEVRIGGTVWRAGVHDTATVDGKGRSHGIRGRDVEEGHVLFATPDHVFVSTSGVEKSWPIKECYASRDMATGQDLLYLRASADAEPQAYRVKPCPMCAGNKCDWCEESGSVLVKAKSTVVEGDAAA